SRDGNWIYFGSARNGKITIWKMPSSGGPPVEFTRNEGGEAFESHDRGHVYFSRVLTGGPGLWRVPAGGGDEVRILDSPVFGYWTVGRRGIYFVDFNVAADVRRPVKFFSFRSLQTQRIGTVEATVTAGAATGFAISPDSRWLLYTSLER